MAAETVTVLFTDLVGSTELLSRVGEAGADELSREHFGLLRAAIAEHGGREVKNLGDGLMVVFDGVAAALDAAVVMQQGITARPPETERLSRPDEADIASRRVLLRARRDSRSPPRKAGGNRHPTQPRLV